MRNALKILGGKLEGERKLIQLNDVSCISPKTSRNEHFY
jgi:hypothetical protein